MEKLKYFIILLAALVLLSQAKILMFSDISIERVLIPSTTKDYKPPVYLISYADGPEVFHKNQNALTASALNKGIDFFLNYKRYHLDKDFIEKK